MTRAYNTATTQQNSGGAVSGVTAGKNAVINGGFDIWQRGTSIACSSTAYTADRWQGFRGVAGATVSRQTSSLTLDSIQYCARVQRDSGNTSTSTIWFSQAIETVNSYPFAGKVVTFSFYARAGANYSAASSNLNVRLRWGTGTDQNPLGTWTGGGFTVSTTATLTTSWQRFTFTGTVNATATQLAAYFGYDGVGTAGAADFFEITGVQLEVGSVATPFSRAGGTIAGELAACQRYYHRTGFKGGVASGQYTLHAIGYEESATVANYYYKLGTTMRVAPTSIQYSGVEIYDNTSRSLSALVIDVNYNNPDSPKLQATGSGMVEYRPCMLLSWNNSSAFVAVSAEL